MSIDRQVLDAVLGLPAEAAWPEIFDRLWQIMSPPIVGSADSEVQHRDKAVESLDLLLAAAAWPLWESFEQHVPRTVNALQNFWSVTNGGRAVLILDGLSLRELPWLTSGALDRGYKIHSARPTGAEMPCVTTNFARAMGVAQRSALESGAPSGFKLSGAKTGVLDQPFEECADTLPSEPHLFLWHLWPDKRLHDLAGPGAALSRLALEAKAMLCSEGFWKFVDRLTTGRRLVITADHGYAASAHVDDVTDEDQRNYLRETFGAQRYVKMDDDTPAQWLPPLDLPLASQHGRHRYVLGRRKWKVQGGTPTLTHGGLSLLEVAVPFIELSRP